MKEEHIKDHGNVDSGDLHKLLPHVEQLNLSSYLLGVLRQLVGVDLLRENEVVRQVDSPLACDNSDTVSTARETLRDALSLQDARAFPRHGHALAAVDQLADTIFGMTEPYGYHFRFCTRCGHVNNMRPVARPLWSTNFNLDLRERRGTVSTREVLAAVLKVHGRLDCPSCRARNCVKYGTRFERQPPMLLLEIPGEDSRFPSVSIERSFTLKLGDTAQAVTWTLQGVLYLGHRHFTCRLINNREGLCLCYDGMQHGGECVVETLSGTDLSRHEGKKACLLLYTPQP